MTVGLALPVADLIRPPALDQQFPVLPNLVTGHVMAQPPLPLAQDMNWMAGYSHALAANGNANPWGQPGKPYAAFSWINHESASYPNADEQTRRGVHTVSVADHLLRLTAMETPPEMVADIPAGYSKTHISGAITSFPHAQTYGVFEMRAKFPRGKGLWPAFWLLPQDMSWPPEADIVEALGRDMTTLFVTSHSKTEQMISTAVKVPDMAAGFHSYTLDWGPGKVAWYFDRVCVRSGPTPTDWHQPMYLLLNLAVGGPDDHWGGAPDATTMFPATMEVSYVRVWQRASYLGAKR